MAIPSVICYCQLCENLIYVHVSQEADKFACLSFGCRMVGFRLYSNLFISFITLFLGRRSFVPKNEFFDDLVVFCLWLMMMFSQFAKSPFAKPKLYIISSCSRNRPFARSRTRRPVTSANTSRLLIC